MRFRTSLFSLAVLALAAVPAAAERPGIAQPSTATSISPIEPSTSHVSVGTSLVQENHMSWSRTFSGNRAAILAAVATVAAEVKATDESYKSSADTIALHQKQVEKAAAAVTSFVEAAPDDYQFSISMGGHGHASTTGEIQSDQWNVGLSTYKPAAVVTA